MVQAVAFVILVIVVWFLPLVIAPPYNLLYLSVLMGFIALILSILINLPKWWLWLQLFFPVIIYLALQQEINPLYFLAIFILLWLIFSNSFGNRVPLYLTNNSTRQALLILMEETNHKEIKFIDLGSGFGGNVVFISKQNNVINSVGVETAPIPYAISKLNSFINGGQIYAQNLWKTSLKDYNFIYAFLSTESMPELWQKIILEADENTIFVSNSFAVPEVTPTQIWELADSRKTHLYIYNVKEFKNDA